MLRVSTCAAIATLLSAGGLASCAPSTRNPLSGSVAASPLGADPEAVHSEVPYDDEELRRAADARRAATSPATEGTAAPGLFDASTSSPLFDTGLELEIPQAPEMEPRKMVPLMAIELGTPEQPIDLDRISTHLELMASVSDDPVSAHFARALLPIFAHALDKPAIDVDDFEVRIDLTEAERQLLHQTAMFSARTRTRLAAGEGARVVLEEELVRLLEAVRDPEPFAITFATLIDEVHGLGEFTSRSSNRFQKGANHDARVYIDFEGVNWAFNGTAWTTELELQIQVMKANGYQVFSTNWESIRDTRLRRVDVFAWSSVTLADDLEIGSYVIKIRARQPDSHNLAEHLLPFEIVSRLAVVGAGS